MSKYFFALLCVLAAAGARAEGLSLRSGLYATVGDHVPGRNSRELALYSTLNAPDRFYPTVGLSRLDYSHPDWTYRQQMATLGALVPLKPFYAKAYYSRIAGRLTLEYGGGTRSDRANVFSGEVMYAKRPFTFGFEYTRYDGRTIFRQIAHQYTLRLEQQIGAQAWISFRPSYVRLLDGTDEFGVEYNSDTGVKRRLFSVAAQVVVRPHDRLTLTGGGFAGERAYYFDNDLLVIYNQDETQTSQEFVQAACRVGKNVELMGEFIYTSFEGYAIRYYVAGARTWFPL